MDIDKERALFEIEQQELELAEAIAKAEAELKASDAMYTNYNEIATTDTPYIPQTQSKKKSKASTSTKKRKRRGSTKSSPGAKASSYVRQQRFNANGEELFCVCNKPYLTTVPMIGCEGCGEWYHYTCVGLSISEMSVVSTYYCEFCRKKNKKLKWQFKAVPEISMEVMKMTNMLFVDREIANLNMAVMSKTGV